MASQSELQKRAKNLMDRHQWEAAIPILEEDAQECPVDPFTLMFLSCCYYELRDFDKALDCAKQAGEIDPRDPLPLGLEGDVFCAMGDYSRAEARYRKALELDSECHLAKKNWKWFQEIMEEKHRDEELDRVAAVVDAQSRTRRRS